MIDYQIISTGSNGNAVVLQSAVLIDCGVPWKLISPISAKLKLVLLTHIHGDHFKPTTIRRLAAERPTLRFGCGPWLALDLLACGVSKFNIDVLDTGKLYQYGICDVIQVPLTHDVPNCGYKVHFPGGKVFYATDTKNLNGITAKDYDLYMVEANYTDEDIQNRIDEKKADGLYAYERRVLNNHLSKAQCDDFIYRNIGSNGEYVYMHCHEDRHRLAASG